MVDVKLSGKPLPQRIADRLKPSSAPGAAIVTQQGNGPQRVVTSIHHSGANKPHSKEEIER
jgi:hypothetical protein